MARDVVKKYFSSDMDNPTVVCLTCYRETKVSRFVTLTQQVEMAKHYRWCWLKRVREWLLGV